MNKPKKVKATVIREVKEIAWVYLDKDGNIEEYDEFIDEIETLDMHLVNIQGVLTVHNS
jgi:hypothetical protein